ncbi:hypothetical protein WOLCODRAFT_166280 [Wolfiporia cocos MD-104 SS10]|uniref:DNA-directed RNA polymerases I and III subunit RPAC1 n=1 Tax=Wolfiporia cocos (strain MD-104) TaxID=742152 RepID=A0A2H3IZQ7_WOLCO|nr:hypothetical protein WOLCODRAFT_166280 [Wolfiporia cocos MD-104 SS10]
MASTFSAHAGPSSLPSSALNPRRHVNVHAEHVSDVSNTEYPGHYPGEDHSWNLAKFEKSLRVEVQRLSQRSIEFDLVGVDASIANAFRRIMIAEVPTMAIERVYVYNNTSVIHDEVLAHRLGLVPLDVNPRLFEFVHEDKEGKLTDRNTLVFSLDVTCEADKSGPREKGAPRRYINEYVTSGDLIFRPAGEQVSVLSEGSANYSPGPTNKNIVLAKLRPGQQIEMELHAVKGVGKEHAKWSPVATASYRLHPLILLNPSKPVPPHLAEKFARCFSPGVVQIGSNGEVSIDQRAMRKESMSREVFRHKEFEGCVQLKRIRDWFIYTVESEGPHPPQELLPEAIQVMRSKIADIRRAAEALLAGADGEQEGAGQGQGDGDGDVSMRDA